MPIGHRKGAGDLDDVRDALAAGRKLVHAAGHPIAAAHVVARDIALGKKRFQHSDDGRLGEARGLVDLLDRRDVQPVERAQDVQCPADRLHRRIGALRRVGGADDIGPSACPERNDDRNGFRRISLRVSRGAQDHDSEERNDERNGVPCQRHVTSPRWISCRSLSRTPVGSIGGVEEFRTAKTLQRTSSSEPQDVPMTLARSFRHGRACLNTVRPRDPTSGALTQASSPGLSRRSRSLGAAAPRQSGWAGTSPAMTAARSSPTHRKRDFVISSSAAFAQASSPGLSHTSQAWRGGSIWPACSSSP
jgi:hypothetical protein